MDDDDLLTHLKCDVELNVTGDSIEAVNKIAARELRKLADRIENNEFEDGFHPMIKAIGEAYGEVYIDYSEAPAERFDA
jgi:hypothetical protein